MRKIFFHFVLCCSAVCFTSANLDAQVNFSESITTELSGDNLSPTDLAIFGVGSNTVAGTVVDALGASPNVDVFTFDVAAGTQLDGISLNSFGSTDDLAFVGINDSASFPFNASELSGDPDQSQFIGGLLFGDSVGTDLLPVFGSSGIGSGFVGPLEAGEYTVYIQQLGGATVDYEFGFSVSAVPEPGSGILLGLALVGMVAKRRRR